MGLQRFPYEQFKGINTRDSAYDLDPSESPYALNVQPIDFYNLRGLRSRYGVTAVAYSVLASSWSDGIFWWKQNRWIVNSGGDLWVIPQGGGVAQKIFTHTTASTIGRWSFAIMEDGAGAEWVWAMPTTPAFPEVAQKYDGVAASTVAWAGSPPNVSTQPTSPSQVQGGICVWRGRMIVWNANNKNKRLYFSNTGNPELPATQYANNYIDFPDDDSSSGLTAVLPHQESLIVFRENGIWQVYDPNTFANKRLAVGSGATWRNMVVSHPNGRFYWLNTRDSQVYSCSLRGDVQLESDKIRLGLEGASSVQDAKLRLTPWNSILINVAGFRMSNDLLTTAILEYFPFGGPGQGAWFVHTFPNQIRGMELGPKNGASNNSEERNMWFSFFNNNTKHHIALRKGEYSDDGTAINASWMSSWRPFISEEPLERLRRIHVLYGGKIDLDVYAEMAPIAEPVAKQSYSLTEINPGVTDLEHDRGFSLNRPETRGRYHAFRIRNNVLNKRFEVDKLEFAFRGGKEHN